MRSMISSIIWIPKYRKMIWKGNLAKRLKVFSPEIADRYEFEIDTVFVPPR